VQAAARHYFQRDVSRLTLRQAAELAAALPSPVQSNPDTHSEFFERHAARIEQRLRNEFPEGVRGAPLEDALDSLRRLFRGSGGR
jgi:monofunctional biosynthetic peptidoglycan transglycosylase